MPAATNKSDLITVTEQDFAKLTKVIDPIEANTALRKREDDTSIKDIIVHRAHWIRLFLGWYADGQAGRTVHIPAKGYKWNALKAYNATLRDNTRDLGWPDAVSDLNAAHADLLGFVTSHSDADLYGGPMTGADSKWTTGRFAEAAGPSHYRSATKWVRACLRADQV